MKRCGGVALGLLLVLVSGCSQSSGSAGELGDAGLLPSRNATTAVPTTAAPPPTTGAPTETPTDPPPPLLPDIAACGTMLPLITQTKIILDSLREQPDGSGINLAELSVLITNLQEFRDSGPNEVLIDDLNILLATLLGLQTALVNETRLGDEVLLNNAVDASDRLVARCGR
ncbi:hypothetical protein BH20ACT5_BH20ACT5_17820 [soil metagenome]